MRSFPLLLLILSLSSAFLHPVQSRPQASHHGHGHHAPHHGHSHHSQPHHGHTSAPAPTAGSLAGICAITDYPDLCRNYTTPFATGPNVDYISMLKIMVPDLKNKTQAVSDTVAHIVADPHTQHQVASNLAKCHDSISDGLGDLNDAMAALAAHNSGNLKEALNSFIIDISGCGDIFDEFPATNPVDGETHTLENLGAVFLAFVYKGYNIPFPL